MTTKDAIKHLSDKIDYAEQCDDKWVDSVSIKALYIAVRAMAEERKKGKWILSDEQRQEDVDNGNYRFICSECGKSDIHSKAVTVSFCWNCGAKMEILGKSE